jgi:hypothetical protein
MATDNPNKSQPDERFILLSNTDSWDLEDMFVQMSTSHIQLESDVNKTVENAESVLKARREIWEFLRASVLDGGIKLASGISGDIPKVHEEGLVAVEEELWGRWRVDRSSFLTWHKANRKKIRDILPNWADGLCSYNENLFDNLIAVESALVFMRKADFWEIGIQERKYFRHKKGLTYLQFLLSHPGKNYSCYELQQIELGYENSAQRHFEKDPEYITPPPESIEENAKIMKVEMAEMQRELEEAKDHNSPDVAILERELNEQAKLYNSLYDHKGRPRDSGSQDNKARKAVTKALKDARDAIVKELPYMEDMLSEVKPGLKIVYLPQNQPVELLTSPLQK